MTLSNCTVTLWDFSSLAFRTMHQVWPTNLQVQLQVWLTVITVLTLVVTVSMRLLSHHCLCSPAQWVWQDIQYRHRPGWEYKFMKPLVKIQPSEWLCWAQFAHSAFGCRVAVETWTVTFWGKRVSIILHLYLMCTSTTCIVVIICWHKLLHTDYWIFKCGQGTRSESTNCNF